jgi:hypothetical protein
MYKFSTLRLTRAAIGLAAVSAFALVPVAAQAADTTATGTLTGGSLSVTAPVITPFTTTLTGATQTVPALVGAWTLNDATGDPTTVYHVTVSADLPTINTAGLSTLDQTAMGGTFLTLKPTTALVDGSNLALQATVPVAIATTVDLNAAGATIDNAAAATGEGKWDFAADTTTPSLGVVIPGDAAAGAYSDTLTYTIATGA